MKSRRASLGRGPEGGVDHMRPALRVFGLESRVVCFMSQPLLFLRQTKQSGRDAAPWRAAEEPEE